jgi:predicted Zn-dependent protease
VSDALELAARALEAAEGDAVEALVQSERSGFARFAGSEVHQPTLIEDESVFLRVIRGGRIGTASGNRVDDEGLRLLAARAAEAADAAPEDPDIQDFAAPASLPDVQGYDTETAEIRPDDQARLAARAIEAAGETPVYGFFTSGVVTTAVATSGGVSAEHSSTDAGALTLAATDDTSGYAEQTSWAVGDVDPAAVARDAVGLAERTAGAGELEPGPYRAVLGPYALGELLQYFAYDTFSGLALLEERSYFCGRLGERCFDEKISIADDALDPHGLPKPFDFEGVPKQRVELVENGVPRGVVWDLAGAKRAGGGQESTGHAPPPSLRRWGPLSFAISVAGGEAGSVEELVDLVGDGVYVTRLHYLGIVEPRQGILTGMTRDGTFRIRNGKLAEPLANLRFTVAVPDLLADVPGLTRERTLTNQAAFYDERFAYGALVPALATARFDVTGIGGRPGI